MTFKRSICVLAALMLCAVTGPRPSAQAYGSCGYVMIGGNGGGPSISGYALVNVYYPDCWGEGSTSNVAVAVQVTTPWGTQASDGEAGEEGWWSDGYIDVSAPLQPGESGPAIVQGWGAIGGWGYWFESYYDQMDFHVEGSSGCGEGGCGGGGGGEDPPPDPPTITLIPGDTATAEYDTGDVIITAQVSPPEWQSEFYWTGEGQETGNPMERRFSSQSVGSFGATAVVYGQTEKSATVKIVPRVVLNPTYIEAVVQPPNSPWPYVAISAQVFPTGAAPVVWSGAGWDYGESSLIRYVPVDVVGTFDVFARAGESQQQQAQVKVVPPPPELRVVLDVDTNFNSGAPSDDSPNFVPGANLDGSSRPVSEMSSAGQVVRLIAYYHTPGNPNQIVSAPAGSSATFNLDGTSAWRGYAMNASFADNALNTAPDYMFPPSGGEPESTSPRTANFGDGNIAFVELRVKDYGGWTTVRAVASTGQQKTMSLPRDDGNNRLPDGGWKATTGTGAESVLDNVDDPWSDADGDIGPLGSPVPPDGVPLNHGWYGDGLIRFHEYRGFVVRGNHVRTDPRRLDVFMSHDVRNTNGNRIDNALDFAQGSLNQFRITAHVLYDEMEGFTEYTPGPGGPVNINLDPGQTIAGYPSTASYQRALRIISGMPSNSSLWGETLGPCEPQSLPGQPLQGGLTPGNVSSMLVNVQKLFNDGNQMPAFTTAMILNEVRKTVAHEMGHGIHISHRPFDPPNTPPADRSQCPDSATIGSVVSVMNNNLQLNGQDAGSAGSQYNAADIRQIRLHLRPNP